MNKINEPRPCILIHNAHILAFSQLLLVLMVSRLLTCMDENKKCVPQIAEAILQYLFDMDIFQLQ